jgi:hypothetical protein
MPPEWASGTQAGYYQVGQRGAARNLRGVGISGHAQEPHHPLTGLVKVTGLFLEQVFICNWNSRGISVDWAFSDMRSNLIIRSQNPK